jgi:hypothetical protein
LILTLYFMSLASVVGDCFRQHTVLLKHQSFSPDALLGNHLISFQEILIWAWSSWIFILSAQVDLYRWCSRNSEFGARHEQLLLMWLIHLTIGIHVLYTWSLPPQHIDSLMSSRCHPVPSVKLMGTKNCSFQTREQWRHTRNNGSNKGSATQLKTKGL